MALRIAKWVGIAIGGLIGLVVLALLALNTSPGKRFIADQLAGEIFRRRFRAPDMRDVGDRIFEMIELFRRQKLANFR